MKNLIQSKCIPCEGGISPLTAADYKPYLAQLDSWTVIDSKKLEREFIHKDFTVALKFVNQVGEIAEQEGHHPDILIHDWNKVKITLRTHAIKGLSVNDFIIAAKIDKLIF